MIPFAIFHQLPSVADLPQSCAEVRDIVLERDWQFVRSDLNMRFENERILEVEVDALEGRVVDERWVSGVVLVEREGVADEDREGILLSPTGSSRLLTQSRKGVPTRYGVSEENDDETREETYGNPTVMTASKLPISIPNSSATQNNTSATALHLPRDFHKARTDQ